MDGATTGEVKTPISCQSNVFDASELVFSSDCGTLITHEVSDPTMEDGATYITVPLQLIHDAASQQNVLLKGLPILLDTSQFALITDNSSQVFLGGIQDAADEIVVETSNIPDGCVTIPCIQENQPTQRVPADIECVQIDNIQDIHDINCIPTESSLEGNDVPGVTCNETLTFQENNPPTEIEIIQTAETQQMLSREQERTRQTIPDVFPLIRKGPFVCTACGKEFSRWPQLRKHVKCHSEEKPYKCTKCSVSYNVESNLALHMATHGLDELKCPQCGLSFSRMASLKAHVMLHEKEESLFCTECGDEFPVQSQLDAHKKEHADEWKITEVHCCRYCNRQFSRGSALREHMKDHYKVKACLSRKSHKRRRDRSSFLHKCDICNKCFQKPSQLVRHLRTHTGEKPYKCELCRRAFSQKGSVQIHMAKHNGLKPFRCDFCAASFSQKGNLRSHVLRVHAIPHSGEQVFRCMECPCIFKKLGSLNAHMSRMHSSEYRVCSVLDPDEAMKVNVNAVMTQLQDLKEATEGPSMKQSEKPLEEPSDSKDILEQALVKSGLSDKTSPIEPIKEEEVRPSSDRQIAKQQKSNIITLADKGFDGTVRRYVIRQRRVGKVRYYQCSFCSKEFKKPSDLVRHIRIHTHEKPFKCMHCFRSFAVKSTLTAHIRTHTGIKNHTCIVCLKQFSTLSSLKVHLRLHTGNKPYCNSNKVNRRSIQGIKIQDSIIITENDLLQGNPHSSNLFGADETTGCKRPFKCQHCNATFRNSSHLKQHARMYTGKKPFQCDICDKRFSTNASLKAHIRRHGGAKVFSCPLCRNSFSTKSSLKRHMATHSETRPYLCPYCHKTFKTAVTCRAHMKKHRQELVLQAFQQAEDEVAANNLEGSVNQFPQDVLAPDFVQAFSENPFNVSEMEQDDQSASVFTQPTLVHSLPAGDMHADNAQNCTSVITHTLNCPESDVAEITQTHDHQNTASVITHTLHADASGTITLPSLEGQTTLTQENIQELERTLNEQIFGNGTDTTQLSAENCQDQAITISDIQVRDVQNLIDDTSTNTNPGMESIQHNECAEQVVQTIPIIPEQSVTVGDSESTAVNTLEEVFESQGFDTSVFLSVNLQVPDTLALALSGSMANMLPQSSLSKKDDDSKESEQVPEVAGTIQEAADENYALLNDSFQPQFLIPQRQHRCDECGRIFKKLTSLSVHMRSHTGSKLYACLICNKKYVNIITLRGHMKAHIKGADLSCQVCNYSFPDNETLCQHMMEHTEERPFQCSICNMQFRSSIHMRRHLRMHSESGKSGKVSRGACTRARQRSTVIRLTAEETQVLAQQPLDQASSLSERVLIASAAERDRISELKDHEQRYKMEPLHPNKCKYCPKSFKKPSDLVRHVRIHTGERPYQCSYCNKCFTVKSTLDCHLKTHGGQKTFSCHVCGFYFSTKGSLKVHMRLHTGAKPFKCPVCDARFRTSGHRKAHLASHIKENSRLNRPPSSRPRKRKEKVNFNVIQEEVKTVAETNVNEAENEDADLEQPSLLPTEDGSHVINNLQFQLTDSFQIDTAGNLIPTQTLQLDESILQQIQASNIIIQASGAEQTIGQETFQISSHDQNLGAIQFEIPFINVQQTSTDNVPPTGDVIFNIQGELDVDMENNEQASTSSPISGSRYSVGDSRKGGRSLVLISDENKMADDLVYHDCQVCGTWFSKPSQLRRHARIHTGEQPFQCTICSKRFNQKDALTTHLKSHRGERPFACPYCDYSFTQKGNLKTHIKRVHKFISEIENKDCRSSKSVDIKSAVISESSDADKSLDLDRVVDDLFPQMNSTFLTDP